MDYLPALGWKPSPNFNSRQGCAIDQVIVHDMEGHIDPSEVLFEERASHVSAHYMVSAMGDRVDRMVAESNRAWHACDFNSRSIGVEMEGFSKSGYASSQMLTAARLAAYLCAKYSIPIRYAKGGVGAGIASHWSLGAAGGGHADPEPDDQWIQAFVGLVQTEHDAGRWPKVYEPGGEAANATPPAKAAGADLATTRGVQEALAALHFSLSVDGQLGPETEAVIRSFQIIAGLKPALYGAIDDVTRAALGKALSGA